MLKSYLEEGKSLVLYRQRKTFSTQAKIIRRNKDAEPAKCAEKGAEQDSKVCAGGYYHRGFCECPEQF